MPSTHRGGQAARDLLEKFGIGINDAVNGVPVPKAIHDRQHTFAAIDTVTDRLKAAIRGVDDEAIAKARLLEELQNLKINILNGDFP